MTENHNFPKSKKLFHIDRTRNIQQIRCWFLLRTDWQMQGQALCFVHKYWTSKRNYRRQPYCALHFVKVKVKGTVHP